MIPQADPRAQYLRHKADIDQALAGVLSSGRYILGEQTRAFETEFAGYIGVTHAVGVGSGTEALHLALRACDVGPGDEVITVAHTAVATVAAVELSGATPVLVDVEPETLTLDPNRFEQAVTERTRAVIPVHLYGHPVDMDPLLGVARRRGLRVIEDAAQAHGALYHGRRVGSLGDAGCFSFYPTKNLGAFGDGGAVVTDDTALAERVRLLREYGWAERYVSHVSGYNSRLDELQAAVLRVKLRWLDEANAARARLAALYREGLADRGLTLPIVRQGAQHAHHLYVVRSQERDALRAHLESRGVGSLVHYPVPVHLQPAYRDRLPGSESLPVTELAARQVLSLPMFPELTPSDASRVVETIGEFQRRR
ncbi:MAG: DegT/DnrJ/EryC1/StrS family aminotransferase [Polyangiaceae bacterium]|nr:DegT/DnrJ/EryC1/StrS family aminotransferase [Polyangiaceae bacterium]